MKYLGFLVILGLLVFNFRVARAFSGNLTFTNNQPTFVYQPTPYFDWLPPNAKLPSGTDCAQQIGFTPETIPSNIPMNGYAPALNSLKAFYANPNGTVMKSSDFATVDGAYPTMLDRTPSTDMIIRWAACKWGLNEDVLRAQAWGESTFREDASGDKAIGVNSCTQPNFNSLFDTEIDFKNNSKVIYPNGCFQSWGIVQDKVYYFNTLWPMVKDSTAFAMDFRGASSRGCINNDQGPWFVNNKTDGGTNGHPSYYNSTGLDKYTGCIATHFSGDWWGQAAVDYWNYLSGFLASKPWLKLN